MTNLADVRNLDVNNIGSWPLLYRAFAIMLICAVVLGLGVYLDTMNQYQVLDNAINKEAALKSEFEMKQQKAVNLEAYKQQMAQMQQLFGEMLRKLPSKTEVASLLTDISQVGLASGLEFELFKPQTEIPIEFYAELPIKIIVKGAYHELGNFVSGAASLPRIVTIHDFSIERSKSSGPNSLVMEVTAKTYRYLDDDEIQEQVSGKKKTKHR